jgi:hypothetical protein
MQMQWFTKITNDEYYGKLGFNSTKIIGYKEAYPDLIERKKQTGFEKVDLLINEVESFLKTKYKGLPYRQTVDRTIAEFQLEITGRAYE